MYGTHEWYVWWFLTGEAVPLREDHILKPELGAFVDY